MTLEYRIGHLDETSLTSPYELLTSRQQESCLYTGNLLFGLEKRCEDRLPLQKLMALRTHQSRRYSPDTAGFFSLPQQDIPPEGTHNAISTAEKELNTSLDIASAEGKNCLADFASAMAVQMKHQTNSHAKPLPHSFNWEEKAKYIGYQMLFEEHEHHGAISLFKQALASSLDQKLRNRYPDNLPLRIGFSVKDLNPDFTVCHLQEKPIFDAINSLQPEEVWKQNPLNMIHTLTSLLTSGNKDEADFQITENSEVIGREFRMKLAADLIHTQAGYNLSLIDSLLYPTYSPYVDAEVARFELTKRVHNEIAREILSDIITSEVVFETKKGQTERRLLFARLLDASSNYPSTWRDESSIPLTTRLIQAQDVREAILDYAKIVGVEQTIADLESAQKTAFTISTEYKRYVAESKTSIWSQDRFTNPLAEICTHLGEQLTILKADRQNYFIKDDKYFEKKEIRGAIAEATQPRITFLFVDKKRKKIMVARHKELGVWMLPVEGLNENMTIQNTYAKGLKEWNMRNGKMRLFSDISIESRLRNKDQYNKSKQMVAVVEVYDTDSFPPQVPKGKTRIDEVRWIDFEAIPFFAEYVPSNPSKDISRPALAVRKERYQRMFHEIFSSKGDILPYNPFMNIPKYEPYQDETTRHFNIGEPHPYSKPPLTLEEESTIYSADREAGYSPIYLYSPNIKGDETEETVFYFTLRLDPKTGLLIPLYAHLDDQTPTAQKAQAVIEAQFPGFKIVEPTKDTIKRIGRYTYVKTPFPVEDKQSSTGQSCTFYTTTPAIDSLGDLYQEAVINSPEKQKLLAETAKRFVNLTPEQRLELLKTQPYLYILPMETAKDILEIQKQAVIEKIVLEGRIGDINPFDIRLSA